MRRCSLGPSIAKQDKAMALLLKRAADRVKKMTPKQREAMEKAQRESWMRQDRD
jgi:hypothetical protein